MDVYMYIDICVVSLLVPMVRRHSLKGIPKRDPSLENCP